MAAIVQQLQASPIYGGVAAYKYGRAQHKQENAGMAQKERMANQQMAGQMVMQTTGQLFDMANQQYTYDRRVELENLSHQFALESMDQNYQSSAKAALFRELGETWDQIGVSAAQSQMSVPQYISKRRNDLSLQKYMAENGLSWEHPQENVTQFSELASEEATIQGQLDAGTIDPADGNQRLAEISQKRTNIRKTMVPKKPAYTWTTADGKSIPVQVGQGIQLQDGSTVIGTPRGLEHNAAPRQGAQKDIPIRTQISAGIAKNFDLSKPEGVAGFLDADFQATTKFDPQTKTRYQFTDKGTWEELSSKGQQHELVSAQKSEADMRKAWADHRKLEAGVIKLRGDYVLERQKDPGNTYTSEQLKNEANEQYPSPTPPPFAEPGAVSPAQTQPAAEPSAPSGIDPAKISRLQQIAQNDPDPVRRQMAAQLLQQAMGQR